MTDQMVYAIGPRSGNVVKIGRSVNVQKRLGQLQPGHPAKLEVLWTTEGGSLLEGELHAMFSERRLFGEWFDFGDLDAVTSIKDATEIIRAWWASICPDRDERVRAAFGES